MCIRMVGIDHSKASLDYREAFSFTKAGVKNAVKIIKEQFHVKGCILLSTCNRTELWISQSDERSERPYEILCKIKDINTRMYEEFFTEREGSEAIEHILNVVCGFDSKIFGEDQIISQVREALQVARQCECADSSLEKIFQTALAAGKRVKTEVRMSNVNRSSANDMIHILKNDLSGLSGVKCLVIGNGQMGKLVANMLTAHGADVSMTLRRKMHGSDEQQSIVPEKCRMIPYDKRTQDIFENRIVVSATLSPHFTLVYEELKELYDNSGVESQSEAFYFFDLAVPRDIDPKLGELENIKLFDIDSMNTGSTKEENSDSIRLARSILNEYKEELERWFGFRSHVPMVREIVALVSDDAAKRFAGRVEGNEELWEQEGAVEEVVRKASSKLLYGLRESLSPELWDQCLEALYSSASKQTLKY